MLSRLIGGNLQKKYFKFFELSFFADLDSEDLSKTITARSFKLGQLIEDGE